MDQINEHSDSDSHDQHIMCFPLTCANQMQLICTRSSCASFASSLEIVRYQDPWNHQTHTCPHHQMTLHHRLTLQRPNPGHTTLYYRQTHSKLKPPSPPAASVQHWLPPHTSDTAPPPYNNERLVSRLQHQTSQLMPHPLIPYTDNTLVH